MTKSSTTQSPGTRSPLQWAIQILGETLITIGLILFLFVAWQLWWTNIEADKIQGQTVSNLAQEFQASAPEPPADASTDNPPVPAPPLEGNAFGIIYIPRFGQDYSRPIAEGTGSDVLDTLGLGHYNSTAGPGEIGNFALAGHRQTNGKVLDLVEELQQGDHIYIQTIDGYYTYTVYHSHIVLPNQVEVIAPNPHDPGSEPTERLLTLTTCHPRYGDTERYIVHAKLENWQPLSAGPPQEIKTTVENA